MLYNRSLSQNITRRLNNYSKVIIVYGPRQVGKTTLVKQILAKQRGKKLLVNADLGEHEGVLSSRDLTQLKRLLSGYDILFIDEAQRIPNIGVNLKIIHENIPDIKVIVSGSSSLDLARGLSEPLTGRHWTFDLFPMSLAELTLSNQSPFELNNRIPEFLQFGTYPETLSYENDADKIEYLNLLSVSYLYKDILDLGGIKYANKLRDLLRLLAFQVGSEVSFSELATNLAMSSETVRHYIDLLQKAFILVPLEGFSRNLRKEITKRNKYYFYDLGIRNAVIQNFNPLNMRSDIGALWENFLVLERIKHNSARRFFYNKYFWRTYTGAEIDYVEEAEGKLRGFEIKWGKKRPRAPKTWLETYDNASYKIINRENYYGFIGLEEEE